MSLSTINESGSDSDTLNNTPLTTPGLSRNNSIKKEKKTHLPSSGLGRDTPTNDEENELAFGTVSNLKAPSKKKLQFEQIKSSAPVQGFNPTNARFRVRWKSDEDGSDTNLDSDDRPSRRQDAEEDEVALRWSSRYNRKGRNSFVVTRRGSTDQRRAYTRLHRFTAGLKRITRNIFRMLFTFPYWDMAFWSGWSYSWGSILFVIDAGFAWVPTAYPSTEFDGEEYSVGMLFFFGALLYQVGATIAYFEAINDGSFHGSAMKRFLEGHEDDQKKLLDQKLHAFFGHLVPGPSKKAKSKRVGRLANAADIEAAWTPDGALEKPDESYRPRRGGVDFGVSEEGETTEYLPWRWWPSWENLKNHHVREIGWWACSIQLFGATLYGMCGVVALPPIVDSLEPWQMNAAYWIPQMVASVGFLTASIMFTLETQEKWYKPELTVLGWWVGFWAAVGSMGFLLCACWGPAAGDHHFAAYQSNLSSLWGSAAYLISALLQWYEAVNKNPIEELFNEPGPMKSFQVHV